MVMAVMQSGMTGRGMILPLMLLSMTLCGSGAQARMPDQQPGPGSVTGEGAPGAGPAPDPAAPPPAVLPPPVPSPAAPLTAVPVPTDVEPANSVPPGAAVPDASSPAAAGEAGGPAPAARQDSGSADGIATPPPAAPSVDPAPPGGDTPAAITLPALPPPATPDISATGSQLLATVTDDAGVATTTPATALPYKVGKSCYGWSISFAPVAGDVVLTEELRLPGPARNWGGAGTATEVDAQRAVATTQRHFDAARGVASAGWCVAKDDPVGAYRYIIRQGDREIARFDFSVGDLL